MHGEGFILTILQMRKQKGPEVRQLVPGHRADMKPSAPYRCPGQVPGVRDSERDKQAQAGFRRQPQQVESPREGGPAGDWQDRQAIGKAAPVAAKDGDPVQGPGHLQRHRATDPQSHLTLCLKNKVSVMLTGPTNHLLSHSGKNLGA